MRQENTWSNERAMMVMMVMLDIIVMTVMIVRKLQFWRSSVLWWALTPSSGGGTCNAIFVQTRMANVYL